jgi:hypothetical protein
MKDEEPHAISDNEPAGEQSQSCVKIKRKKKKKQKIIVSVGFDENLKEFELWDYLYDFETDHFEMEANPDYKQRIQYYEITAQPSSMRKFRLWLMKNNFKYKLDKI